MPSFELTSPDGGRYQVEADSVEQAVKDLHGFRQQEVNKAGVDQANAAPWWAKPFMAAGDAAQTAVDTISGGLVPAGIDKATDYFKGTQGTDTEQMKVAAARNRMGWAGTGLDAIAMARLGVGLPMIPTMVPKILAAAGGGPAARTIIGSTAAAGEGAGYGAVNAATHDEDIGAGTAIGAGAGILGNVVGNIANRGKKFIDENIRGINYDAPQYNLKKLPTNKPPTAMDFVNVANTEAARKVNLSSDPMAFQKDYARTFSKMQDTAPRGTFTKDQRDLTNTVVNPDLATQAFGKVGDFMSNKMVASGAGLGTGVATGTVPAALTSIGAILGGGATSSGLGASR